MILLFLLLTAVVGLGRATFASDGVDCKRTICFIFANCYGNVKGYRDDVIEAIMRRPDEHNNFCTPFTIQMLIEIETRSAHRFDFRVLYNDTIPTDHLYFNLTGLVDITPGRVNRKKGDIYTEMPTSSVGRLGDFSVGDYYFAGLYNYRFSLNGGIDENLFDALRAKFQATFISGKSFKATGENSMLGWPPGHFMLDEHIKTYDVCDPSDITDHCLSAAKGESCGKLNVSSTRIENADECKFWYSNSSEQWLRVHEIACSNGFWTINERDAHSWPVTASVLHCSERESAIESGDDDNSTAPSPQALKSRRRPAKLDPPVCESTKNAEALAFALTIVLAVYSVLAFILVIVLFILLFRKMGALSGPGKFKAVRNKGTRRDRKSKSASKGSSSGSSSSEGTGKEATPGLALNRTVSYKKGKGTKASGRK